MVVVKGQVSRNILIKDNSIAVMVVHGSKVKEVQGHLEGLVQVKGSRSKI